MLKRDINVLIISGNDISAIRKNFITPLIDNVQDLSKLANIQIFANGATCLYTFSVKKKEFQIIENFSDKNKITSKHLKILTKILLDTGKKLIEILRIREFLPNMIKIFGSINIKI